ncbi:monovalent cation/H+ antiporter subunit A [Neopusillimonas maritima]|jgi:multicomponent K+:H+ antiporter subunit A|uniref:Monovalent cation/H+ antiporter subunit A n=1 Tax=Neopusillimonas maritima TaxID=2026239 RepID=A0ABX9MZ16_9BURK|nr:monovalent cation/H+ antiporter subunit A [Neopusillimonas maritima]MBF23625.1 monovalent cation/H+ antiporter subunit A [Pusillimonas sp.]RII83798.1 monovalent cation/H+ antiporter subunit A [Neopusillimonas maritima]|tara:strand:+ start:16578 stop:19505 length:2928 start_codon:yes stop_codon:yes gene_type:complete
MTLLLILALPFLGSIIAAFLPSNARNIEAWLAGFIALGCAGLLAGFYPQVAAGEVIELKLAWIPSALEIDFVLRLDGYAWLFAMLVSIMGALIVLYARYYMSPKDPVPRFFSFFLLFMGSMLGVVLSGNLIQLVVFWELTSLSSFMLIAYWNHRLDARRGARMALTITGMGGLCLLAGMLMLGHVAGSYDLDKVLAAGEQIRAHPWYTAIIILVAVGALTKSAQFPFHIWLPNAMAAPTPVSAYLHSATMVKAGVFLLARFWPVLAGTDEWFWIIGGAGLITLVMGSYAAIFQNDMKGVLAYSTIGHLGLITLLLGMNSTLGLIAAVFHMMNHATFKASLFMAAGIVDHETGTRDMSRLSGLRHAMPVTTTLAIVAAASMAGVPLLNGFLSKEMFFAETVFVAQGSIIEQILPLCAVVAGAFAVTYSLRFIYTVFFGPVATDLPKAPHEPPFWMLVPSALLVLTCLVVGIFPRYTLGPLLLSASNSILGADTPPYSLKVWHGFNLPLVMSLVALAGGIALWLIMRRLDKMHTGRSPLLYRLNGRQTFEALLEFIDRGASHLLDWVASVRLQTQLMLVVAVTVVVAALPLLENGWWQPELATPVNLFFLVLWIAGGACAVGAAVQAKYHRPAALAMAGGAGLTTAMTFAWFSAPDLALTQLVVEVVTVVLILLGLRWLPPRVRAEETYVLDRVKALTRRSRDIILAVAGGAGIAVISYAIMTRPFDNEISRFFVANSVPEGHGSNVVNVILVDFRSFDTLGEICVLGIVALIVYALLRRFRPPPETIKDGPLRRQKGTGPNIPAEVEKPEPKDVLTPSGPLKIPAVLARLLLPMAALVSLFFLLRGHNLPGGGFIAGLIFATAIILQYVVGGVLWVEARQNLKPQYWMGIGLLVSAGAALSAWWSMRPFLSAFKLEVAIPGVGIMPISTVLIFDIGVYMLVIGSTVLILVALAHQSLRFRRKPAPARPTPSPEEAG